MRHEPVAPGFGFDAIIASRFGRDDIGMGGGAAGSCAASAAGRLAGRGGGVSVALFNPNSNAERRGGGATVLGLSTRTFS